MLDSLRQAIFDKAHEHWDNQVKVLEQEIVSREGTIKKDEALKRWLREPRLNRGKRAWR